MGGACASPMSGMTGSAAAADLAGCAARASDPSTAAAPTAAAPPSIWRRLTFCSSIFASVVPGHGHAVGLFHRHCFYRLNAATDDLVDLEQFARHGMEAFALHLAAIGQRVLTLCQTEVRHRGHHHQAALFIDAEYATAAQTIHRAIQAELQLCLTTLSVLARRLHEPNRTHLALRHHHTVFGTYATCIKARMHSAIVALHAVCIALRRGDEILARAALRGGNHRFEARIERELPGIGPGTGVALARHDDLGAADLCALYLDPHTRAGRRVMIVDEAIPAVGSSHRIGNTQAE